MQHPRYQWFVDRLQRPQEALRKLEGEEGERQAKLPTKSANLNDEDGGPKPSI